jgi:hypothetical protein
MIGGRAARRAAAEAAHGTLHRTITPIPYADHSSPEASSMRPLSAPLRRSLWLAGMLYVLYLIAANVFLNTAALAQINRKPETFQAQWRWAWTAWPGQIHASDITINGHARLLLWRAHGASAGGRVMLWPLLRRELRFGSVRVSGMTVDVQPASTDHKPPPFNSKAWRITADNVHTGSLREIRWGGFVVDGNGSGAIGFTHQLRGGASRIFPSHIEMPTASVSYGRWPVLHDAKFAFAFAFDDFTHDDPPGWRKAQKAVGRLKVEAATMPLALGADKKATQALASALPGHLTADISFDRGSLLSGGRLQWNAPVAITEADGSQQRRRGQFDLQVQPDTVDLHARILPQADATDAKAMNQLDANLQYASRRLLPLQPTGEELRQLSGDVHARWHFASLQWLSPLVASKPWLQLDGEGDIHAALKIKTGRLLPGSTVDVPHVALRAQVQDNLFAGDAHAHAKVTDGAEDSRTHVTLEVQKFTVTQAPSPAEAYLRGHDLQVSTMSSADLVRQRDTLDAHLRFSDAQVPDLRAYNHYLAGKSLQFLAGNGTLGADLHVNGRGDISHGQLKLRSSGAHFALGVSRLSGNLAMDTQLTLAQKGDGRQFDLDDFSLGMDGVHVDGTSDPPWWARFTISHGQLDWNRPMRLRGSATIVMKDVSLLLSLFADRSAFPKWIAKVINDGQATAHAQVQMQKGDFVLDHLVASNKRVDLFAHLRIRDGQPMGDLYARWGILGLGVGLADGKREFHLLHAHDWYEAQPDLIPPQVTSPH